MVPIQTYIIFFKWIERIKILMKNYFKSNEEEKEYPYRTLTLQADSERQFKEKKNDFQLI